MNQLGFINPSPNHPDNPSLWPSPHAGNVYHPNQAHQAFPPDGVNHAPSLNQQPYFAAAPSHAFQYTYAASVAPELTGFTSPAHTSSPNNSFAPPPPPPQQQPVTSSHISTPPTAVPMAAPPLPPSPANAQQQQSQQPQLQTRPAVATPSTPQSPTTATSTRDQQRVALLLQINEEILTEIQRLQAANQGGAMNPQQVLQLRQAGQADKMASDDYIQLLRRLQANLAYLMPRTGQASNSDARITPGPMYMQHPPQMPQLAEKYASLRELFPDWTGNDAKLAAMASASAGAGSPIQPQQQQQQQQQNQQPSLGQQQFHMQQAQQQQAQQQQYNANGGMS